MSRKKNSRTGRDAAQLENVTYRNLWPGITLACEGSGGIVQSRYLLAAGARVEDIRLRYNVNVSQDGSRGLRMQFATGVMQESAPVAWQAMGGQRTAVSVAFRTLGDKGGGFSLGDHDPSAPLVIDPILARNTFLGTAGGDDYGQSIATDRAGNSYVAGIGAPWGNPLRAHSGTNDAFVAKLDAAGNLIWNTFLGSPIDDFGTGIAVDSSGDA